MEHARKWPYFQRPLDSAKELQRLSKNNYTKFLELFDDFTFFEVIRLRNENHIYDRKDRRHGC